jgi:predicted transcriptional regulator
MGKLEITRFGGDFPPTRERFEDLKSLIEQCDDLYPGIDIWYNKKVVPGLREKARTAYVLYEEERPVGATIVRVGKEAKICSLRILPEAEQKGYGTILMALAARDLRNIAESVHFTIPDHIWEEKLSFFTDYGFESRGSAGDQYRLFDRELFCQSSFWNVWLNVLKSLPKVARKVSINGLQSDYDLVMSVRPEYASMLFGGKKTVEVRRQFSDKWTGSKTLVYSSMPEGRFVGSFRIKTVVSDHPTVIWQSFGSAIGCDRKEFESYTKGKTTVHAIIIADTTKFKEPIPMTQLSRLVSSPISAPQSYGQVYEDSALDEAASICTLLQGTL